MLADDLQIKKVSGIWNLKKGSWFLTNQSSLIELRGLLLFSNWPVGAQLACFAWDYLTW